jgi:hypothetical protein
MEASFLQQALDQLRFINWQIARAEDSDRRALEGAREELVTLIQVAMSRTRELNVQGD